MTRSATFHDRPASMMDLLTDHAVRLPQQRPASRRVTHLPNLLALAVLDQMFAYHDQDALREAVDLSYDDVAA